MALAAFLPFLLSLALVLFFALGWRREHRNLEEIKERRAKVHSIERAQLAAKHFQDFSEVHLTGVLRDGDTLLIGYRKHQSNSTKLFPGERATSPGAVEGTIIAWPSVGSQLEIDKLNKWLYEQSLIYLRVNESGSLLVMCDSVMDETVSINLIPSKL